MAKKSKEDVVTEVLKAFAVAQLLPSDDVLKHLAAHASVLESSIRDQFAKLYADANNGDDPFAPLPGPMMG